MTLLEATQQPELPDTTELFISCNNREACDNLTKSKVLQRYWAEYVEQNKRSSGLELEERIKPKFTGETLVGSDKIGYRTATLSLVEDEYVTETPDIEEPDETKNNKAYTFFHLGNELTGHAGIVHGGMLATLLDELTCRLAFLNFKSRLGVTALLKINYRQPCYANSHIMVKCEVVNKKGRKCLVRGTIYKFNPDSDGTIEDPLNLLTECECLVVEPKWVDQMKKPGSN